MPQPKQPVGRYLGGNFAPPLPPDLLKEYRALFADNELPDRLRDVVDELLVCAEKFQETPHSKLPGQPHPTVPGVEVTPLEDAEKERMWDHIPWRDQLDQYGQLLEQLPDGNPRRVEDAGRPKGYRIEPADPAAYALRNAAFHLLWYARELELDREPITTDKL